MTAPQLAALTTLLMVSDPSPLAPAQREELVALANAAAMQHGAASWIDAYHTLN